MAKYYRTKLGAAGCYVLTGHGMVVHICSREVDQKKAEELAELLDHQYELGLIRGVNGHPDAIALRPRARKTFAERVAEVQGHTDTLPQRVRVFLQSLQRATTARPKVVNEAEVDRLIAEHLPEFAAHPSAPSLGEGTHGAGSEN